MRRFRSSGVVSAVGMAVMCGLAACTAVAEAVRDLASYVDPFIGTAGTANCHPDACCPHGMVQAGPSSGTAQWKYCGGYQFEDRMLYGFVQNAICGTGVPDLGDIRLQPFVGDGENEERTAEKSDEKASPGYYAVSYPKQGIRTEVAASPHVAFYTFTFGERASHGKGRPLPHFRRGGAREHGCGDPALGLLPHGEGGARCVERSALPLRDRGDGRAEDDVLHVHVPPLHRA